MWNEPDACPESGKGSVRNPTPSGKLRPRGLLDTQTLFHDPLPHGSGPPSFCPMHSSPLILLLSAPSGGGKTTVCERLLQANPSLRRVITCTTRSPRPGEVDGVDYHFLGLEEFRGRRDRGDFLEWAEVYGHGYGTLKESVRHILDEGRDVLLNIDVQGAASVRQVTRTDPSWQGVLVTVFLLPSTPAELEVRLRGRGTEDDATLNRRLVQARIEVQQAGEFDYVVVSGTRDEDWRRLQSIYDAERVRCARVLQAALQGWEHRPTPEATHG
jgi:guanylate kinase